MFDLKERFVAFKKKLRGSPSLIPELYDAILREEWSRYDLLKYSFIRRKEIVTYAYNHCSFYKKYYDDNGFHPTQLITESDWEKVPIIIKKDIKDNYDKFISDDVPQGIGRIKSTGGSTGTPLKVLSDTRVSYYPILYRSLRWYNVSFASNYADVGRNVKPKNFRHRFFRFLNSFPVRKMVLDASSITEKDLSNFCKKIDRVKPKYICGYAGTILNIARYIVENNIQVHKIDLIWTTSSPISNLDRHILKKAFGGEIMDQYGSVEVSAIAMESPEHIGLYVPDDYRYVEIVDDEYKLVEDGVYGNIVVTDFCNRVFPLIRYKNNDVSRKLTNKGIYPFTLIDSIKGRVSDYIITPSGRQVSGEYLTTIFDDYPDIILAFQVIQHKDYSLTIKYIPLSEGETLTNSIENVNNGLKKVTNEEVLIDMIAVSEIKDEFGKFRFVINELTGNLKSIQNKIDAS